MIDINKQIEYWKLGSQSNLETAEVLFANNKTIEGLFFCHLAVEKIFKAAVVQKTNEIPPRTHDLFRLSELAGINLEDKNISLCQILMTYQLEGRYPDYQPLTPDKKVVHNLLLETKSLVVWIKEKL